MRARLERYANRLWYQTDDPPWPWRVLSGMYRQLLGSRWRRPTARPPIPVVVVGNLAVGGSGKTPAAIALTRHLAGLGLKTSIISRGHGRARSGKDPVRVGPDSDPGRCGDEPVLIAQQTGLPVWICRDRGAALEAAVAAGAEVVVSDDGLQHRQLARSFEIALIDGRRGFGNGRLLPAGPLRQPVARLEQVDVVLFRGPRPPGAGAGLQFHLQPEALVRLADGARLAPEALSGTSVSAVCAIADPVQFVRSLEALGQVPTLCAFPDHHRFTDADLDGIPPPIVTTAKDAVKLRRLNRVPQPLYVLEINAVLPQTLLEMVTAHVQQFAR